MTERGILFSPPMVRALLDGSKTQTRRVVKQLDPQAGAVTTGHGGQPMCVCWAYGGPVIYCPYGQPGDRLWVRETFVAFGRWETRYSEKKKRDEWHFVDMTLETGQAYRFEGENPLFARDPRLTPTWHKRPSIFMPRAASRILLDVVSVRVERLNQISESDCWAEGIDACDGLLDDIKIFEAAKRMGRGFEDAAPTYAALWETINGTGSWEANPWVWVVEFRRIEA